MLAAAVAFTSASQLLLEMGFGAALIQRQKLDAEHLGTAFWSMLAVAIILAGALAMLSPLVASYYRSPDVAPVLRVLSLGLVLGVPDTYYGALLSRELRFKLIGLRRFAGVVVAGVVGIGLAVGGAGVWSLVAYSLSRTAVGRCFWRWHFARCHQCMSSVRPSVSYGSLDAPCWEPALLITPTVTRTTSLLADSLEQVPLGNTVGYQLLVMPLQLFARPVSSVSLPLFSRLQDDIPRLAQAYVKGTGAIISVVWPVCGLVTVSAISVIPVPIGTNWTGAAHVASILGPCGQHSSL